MKMTYGAIEGSDALRSEIAAFYDNQAVENVIITHGTIGANMLVHKTLLSAGDRVISVVPTYQQHYSIPASIGAKVQHLHLEKEESPTAAGYNETIAKMSPEPEFSVAAYDYRDSRYTRSFYCLAVMSMMSALLAVATWWVVSQ